MHYDVSLFYIDWRNIQVQVNIPNSPANYIANAGKAKSQGAESSLEVRPLPGQAITATLVYTDAVLKDSFPPTSTTYGPAGAQLPFSSRWAGTLALDQKVGLLNDVVGIAGFTVSYVGDRKGIFRPVSAPQRQDYPAYTKLDFRFRLLYEAWKADFYVNNVTDSRGLLSGGLGAAPPTGFTVIQPRTFGASITRDF
jgi:outer membrane receptor protein involved in Fe transport